MSLDPKMENLLKSFVQLCDTMVEEAFVITNGLEIAGIVLQEELAQHICRKVINTYKDPKQAAEEWTVCNFANAMKYSFERGYRSGIVNTLKTIREEVPEGQLARDETKETDNVGQDTQLRDGEL